MGVTGFGDVGSSGLASTLPPPLLWQCSLLALRGKSIHSVRDLYRGDVVWQEGVKRFAGKLRIQPSLENRGKG